MDCISLRGWIPPQTTPLWRGCVTPARPLPVLLPQLQPQIYGSTVPAPNTPPCCPSKSNNNKGEGLEQFNPTPEPGNSHRISLLGLCCGQRPAPDTYRGRENKPVVHFSQLCLNWEICLCFYPCENCSWRKVNLSKGSQCPLSESTHQNASSTCTSHQGAHQQNLAEFDLFFSLPLKII